MKLVIASLLAATTLATLTSTTASAGTCNVVANHVTGNGNFVDLDVSGCGYVSNHMRGSYSFAQIINRLGRVVSGVYGNDHYYQVQNIGDNHLGIYVNGSLHSTRVRIEGDSNTNDIQQTGRPSSVSVRIDGDGNTSRIRSH